MCASRFSNAYHLGFVDVVGFAHGVEHFEGVILDCGVEHVLDLVGTCALMRDDE